MSFLLSDVDLVDPLPTFELSAEQQGLALLVRHSGRPIGFHFRFADPGTNFPPAELANRLWQEFGWKLVQDATWAELCPTRPPVQPPSLTIAICTKDRPKLLDRCLNSLRRLVDFESAANPDRIANLDIVVVDNAPSDRRTQELVARHAGVRYALEPIAGLDFARNRALAEARGDWLAYLDDDAIVDRFWLTGLAEAIADNPDAGALTGAVLPLELSTRAQVLFEARGGFQRGFERIRYGQELPGNTLYPCGPGIFGAGCNMAFRRDALRKMGGFDEALDTGRPLPGGGDLDIFYRTIRAGYVLVYEPRMLVFHEHRRDIQGLRRQYYTWGLGLSAFVAKSYRSDPAMRAQFRGLMKWLVRDHLRRLRKSLARRDVMPADMVIAELWGTIVGLFGEYGRSQSRVAALRKEEAA